MKSGIYAIRNRRNDKLYIGSSVNISHRWAVHRSCLRLGNSSNRILQHAWNKYGEAAFSIDILETCEPIKQTLLDREDYWLAKLKPAYNIGTRAMSRLGVTVDLIGRANMAAGHVSNGPNGDAWRAAISAANAGNAACGRKGIKRLPRTDAEKQTISLALIGKGKGRKQSAEHVRKRADAKRGKPLPQNADVMRRNAANWIGSLTNEERMAFYARRAATLKATLAAKAANRM